VREVLRRDSQIITIHSAIQGDGGSPRTSYVIVLIQRMEENV
jgi:hypothetical protein